MTRRPACSAGVDSQGVVALLYVVAALIARTVPLTNLPALVLAASFAYVPLVALCAVLLAALCRKLSRCPSGPFAGHLGWPSGLNWARISVVSAAICSSSWRLVFTGAPFGGGVLRSSPFCFIAARVSGQTTLSTSRPALFGNSLTRGLCEWPEVAVFCDGGGLVLREHDVHAPLQGEDVIAGISEVEVVLTRWQFDSWGGRCASAEDAPQAVP